MEVKLETSIKFHQTSYEKKLCQLLTRDFPQKTSWMVGKASVKSSEVVFMIININGTICSFQYHHPMHSHRYEMLQSFRLLWHLVRIPKLFLTLSPFLFNRFTHPDMENHSTSLPPISGFSGTEIWMQLQKTQGSIDLIQHLPITASMRFYLVKTSGTWTAGTPKISNYCVRCKSFVVLYFHFFKLMGMGSIRKILKWHSMKSMDESYI